MAKLLKKLKVEYPAVLAAQVEEGECEAAPDVSAPGPSNHSVLSTAAASSNAAPSAPAAAAAQDRNAQAATTESAEGAIAERDWYANVRQD